MIAENPDIQNILNGVLDNLDFVRNSEGYMLRKVGPNWINSIGDWVTTEGYLFRMNNADSFEISGEPINESTPIELNAGYQIISYLPSEPRDCEEVFTFVIENLDFVRNTAGYMMRKIGPNWVNSIGNMQPGEGYLVKMNSVDELYYLNYPPEPPSSPNPEDGAENQLIQVDLSWTCTDPEGYPLSYDIYFGTEATPTLVISGQAETTYDPGTLEYNTEYFWKIIAHDDHSNTTEGTVWSFTTEIYQSCPGIQSVTYEGKVYNTLLIGDQCWLKENLNVGTMINGTEEMTDNSVIEKYCYDNDPANCEIYGGLYQWNEMMQYTIILSLQGICPDGWHLPEDGEWIILSDFLGGVEIAGGKMKEVGTTHWKSPNVGATNESGFTALPGGDRSYIGSFENLADNAFFWSSSEDNSSLAWNRYLNYNGAGVARSYYDKTNGMSVRCLKD
jgi:uncharacterized protein (TIGR02145 family)